MGSVREFSAEKEMEVQKRRFDEYTLRQLDGKDLMILEHLMFLCKVHKQNSKSGASYAIPSQMWLAKKIGIRRETVSRHITKLARLGILEVTHRRQVKGKYKTNMYRIREWKWWRTGKAIYKLRHPEGEAKSALRIEENKTLSSHVTETQHKTYKCAPFSRKEKGARIYRKKDNVETSQANIARDSARLPLVGTSASRESVQKPAKQENSHPTPPPQRKEFTPVCIVKKPIPTPNTPFPEAHKIISHCYDLGIRFVISGKGQLGAVPPHLITDEIKQSVAKHLHAILAILQDQLTPEQQKLLINE
jgi:DNA-binding transcriptional ArsR family regulator